MDTFIDVFACIPDQRPSAIENSSATFGPSTLGLLVKPGEAERLEQTLLQANEIVAGAVSEILGLSEAVEYEALLFLDKAHQRFVETENPYWAWFTFAVYLRAGLPAPGWVWEYLAAGAFEVLSGAAARRDLRCSAEEAGFEESDMINALGLSNGKHDAFDRFRIEIEEFRLALAVNNLVDFDNPTRIGITDACERVAQQRKAPGKLSAEGQQVRRAFEKWFPDRARQFDASDGRI